MSSRRTFLATSLGLAGIASLASAGTMASSLLSTKTSATQKGADDNLAPPQIKILSSDPVTGDLVLSDHGNSKANRGDVITWVIGPNSGVSAITSIAMKDVEGNSNIFSKGPAPLGNSKNWQGTIDKNLPAGVTQEIYNIVWIDNSTAPGSHTFDPVIQVNP